MPTSIIGVGIVVSGILLGVNQASEITRVASLYKRAVRVSVKSLTEILYNETTEDYKFSLSFVKKDLPKQRLYREWKEHYDGIINDCVTVYGMERWMAESMFGINLDRFVEQEFKKHWTRLHGQKDK